MAKQCRAANPATVGDIPDAATIKQLVVLSNMESINAMLIHQSLNLNQRLQKLIQIAITQMKQLLNNKQLKKLK